MSDPDGRAVVDPTTRPVPDVVELVERLWPPPAELLPDGYEWPDNRPDEQE